MISSKIYSPVYLSLLAGALLALSCEQQELETFDLDQNNPTTVVPDDQVGDVRKDGELVVVPLSVSLPQPASKAFQVELQLNPDTVNQLIGSGQLADVVAVPTSQVSIPTAATFAFGSKISTFDIAVNLGFLERNYGKRVALAYRLVNPGKGNTIAAESASAVVVLNTVDILQPDEIRYLSITNGGGGILEARNRQNYQSQSGGMNIPLGISLAGVPGKPFTVRAVVNPDTIATLIDAGVLPENTVPLTIDQVTMDTVNRIGSNTSAAPLDLFIQWSVVEQYPDELLAVAVTLDNPSIHVLDEEKKSVIVLIHPQHVLEVDVTNQGTTYSVNRDNGGGPEAGEGSLKLIDNNINSKFLVGDFRGDLWAQLEFDEATKIGAYTLTSANDAQGRDPKSWRILASNNGTDWVEVDIRTDEEFPQRFQTRRFEFNNEESYSFYRIHFDENRGDGLWQLAEWRVIRIP
ncbi:discoidin domain-containing protein [Parapedobacter soli]|uniref:discoidin domain-containing protein n=1 Tax=Parapedobacter soli TaxID=416955 RepID=UPI0021C6B97D|nr:discoidin domain-containing protein [Parapedobacter soli]